MISSGCPASTFRIAYSISFRDPYGHRLEVTTDDYEAVRVALTPARGSSR